MTCVARISSCERICFQSGNTLPELNSSSACFQCSQDGDMWHCNDRFSSLFVPLTEFPVTRPLTEQAVRMMQQPVHDLCPHPIFRRLPAIDIER